MRKWETAAWLLIIALILAVLVWWWHPPGQDSDAYASCLHQNLNYPEWCEERR